MAEVGEQCDGPEQQPRARRGAARGALPRRRRPGPHLADGGGIPCGAAQAWLANGMDCWYCCATTFNVRLVENVLGYQVQRF